MQELRSYLREGKLLIADGATGTMLQEKGLPSGTPPEAWNVGKPEVVKALHRAYLDAGSQLILTNSFGGSRVRLAQSGGLQERVDELNRAAASLATGEAGGQAYVAGDIGPTGELMAPLGELSYEEAVDVFAQQVQALVDGGVDLIWVETMSDLSEARAAIEAAKQVTDAPVFCSLSFGPKARTMMGVTPTRAAEALWRLGLTAIGGNCGEGVEVMIPVLSEMRAAIPEAVLIAKPNAGLPRLEKGKTIFDMGPQEMASHARQWVELSAQVIGGCCGSTPEHISAIVGAL